MPAAVGAARGVMGQHSAGPWQQQASQDTVEASAGEVVSGRSLPDRRPGLPVVPIGE